MTMAPPRGPSPRATPPPEPGRNGPRPLASVKMRTQFPLFVHWVDRHPSLDGESIIVVEHVMTPCRRWERLLRLGVISRDGWRVKTVLGFLAVSHRISI
jgi:hypothetical protein